MGGDNPELLAYDVGLDAYDIGKAREGQSWRPDKFLLFGGPQTLDCPSLVASKLIVVRSAYNEAQLRLIFVYYRKCKFDLQIISSVHRFELHNLL